MITNKNEAKTMLERIPCDCKCKLDSATCNSNQKCNSETCQCEFENYSTCKKRIIVGIVTYVFMKTVSI